MTLQHLTLALAAFAALIALWSLAAPAAWRAAMQAYPRWQPAGWALVVVDMVWFGLNIKATPLSSFDDYKRYLWFVVAAIVYLLIRYLGELLAARALGGLMLLVPGALFDASRVDYDTPCRLVAVAAGYIIAIAGCFIVAGPHRFRAWMARPISSDGSARTFGAVTLVIAIGLGAVALLCYAPRAT